MRTMIALLAAVAGLSLSAPAGAASPVVFGNAANCSSSDVEWTFNPPVTSSVGEGTFHATGNWFCVELRAQAIPGVHVDDPVTGEAVSSFNGRYVGNCGFAFLTFTDERGQKEGEGEIVATSIVSARVRSHEVSAQILVDDDKAPCDLSTGRGPATATREEHKPDPAV